MDKELVVVPRATLDIYKYKENGCTIYEFDATECSPPEPMVNTIVTLEMLQNEDDRLKVTFFHEPQPLFERVSALYSYESQEQEGGDFLVTFKKR
jgi:uncharacterized protein (DUF2249 family)